MAGAPGFRRRASRPSLSLCRNGLSRELFEHPSANPRSALGRDGFTGNAHRAQVRSYGGPARIARKKRRRSAFFSFAIRGVSATAASTAARSEEHTSELQSLMRISYAVFCLKKKK